MEPDILVETDKAGKSNLEFEAVPKTMPSRAEKEPPEKVNFSFPALAIEDIRVDKLILAYKNGKTGKIHVVTLASLSADAGEKNQPVQFTCKGAYNEMPFEAKGSIGPLSALIDPARPCTVRVTVNAGGADASFDGTIADALNAQGINIAVQAKIPSLSNLAKLANVSRIPDIGLITAGFTVMDSGAKNFGVSDLKATFGLSDMSGSAKISMAGKRPQITASLSSRKIDFSPFIPKKKTKKGTADKSSGESSRPEKVFSSDPLPLGALKIVDADIIFRADRIHLPYLVLNQFTVGMMLKDGGLTIKPLKAMIGGGSVDGQGDLRPLEKNAAIEMDLKVDKLDIGAMRKEAGTTDIIEGQLDAQVRLKGRGISVSNMMAGLNGKIFLMMGKGKIENKYIDLLGADIASDVFRMLNPTRERTNYTDINCMVCGFEITKGIAESTGIVFDTPAMTVVGEGKIELATEKLDLSMNPSPKQGVGASGVGRLSLSLGELAKPFKLGGTLARPKIGVDSAGAAIVFAKTVGGVVLFGPFGGIGSACKWQPG